MKLNLRRASQVDFYESRSFSKEWGSSDYPERGYSQLRRFGLVDTGRTADTKAQQRLVDGVEHWRLPLPARSWSQSFSESLSESLSFRLAGRKLFKTRWHA